MKQYIILISHGLNTGVKKIIYLIYQFWMRKRKLGEHLFRFSNASTPFFFKKKSSLKKRKWEIQLTKQKKEENKEAD